jgi:hypothetical protein
MKLVIITGFIFCLAAALPAAAQQDVRPIPSWVSDRGYWVVENSHADSSIVYFYNNDNQLLYKEAIKGRLNADRKKTKLWLTKQLEQVVTACENRKDPSKAVGRRNPSLYRQFMNGASGLSSY